MGEIANGIFVYLAVRDSTFFLRRKGWTVAWNHEEVLLIVLRFFHVSCVCRPGSGAQVGHEGFC